MVLTYAHKLLMLTNGDIIESDPVSARKNRLDLVKQFFSKLSEVEQTTLSKAFEYQEIERMITKSFPQASRDVVRALAHDAIRNLDKMEQETQSQLQGKNSPPDVGGWEPH